MSATYFANPKEFRAWLLDNHKTAKELVVGYYKVESKKPTMTWSESVDQALCFGWIDGVRKSIDHESYSIRFTPRKKTSIWSTININKVAELTKSGQMTAAGLEAFSYRTEHKSDIYAHENEHKQFGEAFEKQFKNNTTAWDFFIKQAPSYKKVITHWVMSAKQEKTRMSRMEKLILESEQQRRIL